MTASTIQKTREFAGLGLIQNSSWQHKEETTIQKIPYLLRN